MRTLTLNIKDEVLLRRIEFLPDTELEKVLLKALIEYTDKQINWEVKEETSKSYDLQGIMQILQQMKSVVPQESPQESPTVKHDQESSSTTINVTPYVEVDEDFDDDDMDLMK